jgi:hypothetical protein
LLVYLLAGVMLDNNAAPMTSSGTSSCRRCRYIVDALKGLFQATAIGCIYEGADGHRCWLPVAMDQNCPTHVSGFTGALATASRQTGAAINITAGTSFAFRGDIIIPWCLQHQLQIGNPRAAPAPR